MLLSKINKSLSLRERNLYEIGSRPLPLFFFILHLPWALLLKSKINKSIGVSIFMSEKLKQVKVNLYPYQHEQIKNLAAENNTTIAQYIREQLALNLAPKDTRKIYKNHEKVTYKKTDPKLIYELSKIGNNLNQISRNLNQKKDVSNIEILQTLVSIEEKIKELK